jgi:hypothetical protein
MVMGRAKKPAQPRKRKRASAPAAPKPPHPTPTASDTARIAEAAARVSQRKASPEIRLFETDGKVIKLTPPHTDFVGWGSQMKDVFGTASHDFAETELARLMNACGLNAKTEPRMAEMVTNTALAFVTGICAKNELEAALASQMAATHTLTMDMLGRSARCESHQARELCINMATKMQRTFVAQCEALSKMRRDGSQKVRVEHIHVYPGAKAHVGDVRVGGEGEVPENEKRAHAPLVTYAPGVPMWGADPEGECVPQSGDASGEMPHAWRRQG